RNTLGRGYEILEEGFSGRTTIWDDPVEGLLSGRSFLRLCLRSHQPLDLVVLMLGTNDLKSRFGASAEEIAEGMGDLVDIVLSSGTGPEGTHPNALVIAPPVLDESVLDNAVFAGGLEKSKRLGELYLKVTETAGCHFLDAAPIIRSSPIDGIHLEAEAHHTLGTAIGREIMTIYPNVENEYTGSHAGAWEPGETGVGV
ncbi:MAG: GDSL-type esterase/lipase family protein, partial [Anaerolineales bacterium]|nr:GDSL-type esterase/lipase family protein [Anaerolineales bacterium]